MRPRLASLALALCGGCAGPTSFIDFTRSDTMARYSNGSASGSVDNAGNVALDDEAVHFGAALGGLGAGPHPVITVSLLDKRSSELLAGNTCNATLDPHDGSNGSTVSAVWTCTALHASGGGPAVNLVGRFITHISDRANNP